MLLVNSCGQLCHVLQDMFIMKATKAMIHDRDLPMFLWEKESSTTVYAHTRILH